VVVGSTAELRLLPKRPLERWVGAGSTCELRLLPNRPLERVGECVVAVVAGTGSLLDPKRGMMINLKVAG
jgi:hypothetical protein